MRFATATALLGVAGLTVVAAAQTPPAAPAIARTVVAGTKLPSLGDTPLYFRVVSVSIPPGQNISLPASNGILYQLSGSTEVSAGEAKTITGGGGVLIASGTIASLTAGNGEQSALLYFLLAPKEALDQPVAGAPATVKELYRTTAPLPELKPNLRASPPTIPAWLFGEPSHPRQKCGMRSNRVAQAPLSRNAVSNVSTQNLIGGTNGNHTHDTSRSSNDLKSLNPSD